MANEHIILVNNTGCDIRDFDNAIINGIKSGAGLPEELADLFSLEIIEVDGKVRGILRAA